MRRTRVGDVMTKGAITASPATPFKEIVRLMETYGISAVPVIDLAGTPVGIVSEADLMLKEEYAPERRRTIEGPRRRAERERAEGTIASQLMTSPVITVGSGATIAEAAKLMHENRVKRLPVVDDEGRLIGIAGRRDLLSVFMRSDPEIYEEVVNEVIRRTLWIDDSALRVVVSQGMVTLEGRVETATLAGLLIDFVTRVDGVVGIDDRLSFDVDDRGLRALAGR